MNTLIEKKLAAILPVRTGSQRVPNKNFKKFCHSSLFSLKLDMLLSIPEIDEVVVSSDSKGALEEALEKGALTHKREAYYAGSKCTNSEFFLNFLEMTNAEYILYSPCTAPLITSATYRQFINCFYNIDAEFDSIASVGVIKKHLWDSRGPLNYDLSNAPNSQDLPDIFCLTYGMNIISREKLLEHKNIIGKNPSFFVIDPIESIDIDNHDEFEIAQYFYNKLNNV